MNTIFLELVANLAENTTPVLLYRCTSGPVYCSEGWIVTGICRVRARHKGDRRVTFRFNHRNLRLSKDMPAQNSVAAALKLIISLRSE